MEVENARLRRAVSDLTVEKLILREAEAGKLLSPARRGLESVPTLRLSHLNAAQRRAYVIADNKLALNAGWDREVLANELQALIDVEFDVELTGFSLAEVDLLIDEAQERSPEAPAGPEDEIPPLLDGATAVTRTGDVWLLGRLARLGCGADHCARRSCPRRTGW